MMRILANSGRTGGAGFCFIPLRKMRGPIHEWSRKVRTRQQLLWDSDKSSWMQGTEMLPSWRCCEVWAPRKASMALPGRSSHTGGSASTESRQRHIPELWISFHTLTKLQQMFSLGRMPASSTAGWHSNRILFHILPFILLSHWEETWREREIAGLQLDPRNIQEGRWSKNPNQNLLW